MTRIAIVGGGPGGLFTAHLLEEFCADLCEATLFEAGPRLGGKILTEQFATAPVPYEGGVAEVYDYSHFGPDPIRDMVAKLGLSTIPMTGPAVILGDAILRNNKDIRRHFGAKTLKAIQDFQQKCQELCSPEDYYEGHWQDDNQHAWAGKTFRDVLDEIPDETARKYIEVAARSDVATESHLTTALNGLKNVLMDDPRYLRLYAIEGGIERLTSGLAGRLKTPMHFESPVVKVGKNEDGTYQLTTRCQGRFEQHTFDMVVLALPNYWLSRMEWDSRTLRMAMQKHLAHYDTPAHYLRISMLFKNPFWRDEVPGSYFMMDAFGGCCVYDEGARHVCDPYGVLGFLLAGNDAMSLGNYDDARLTKLALDALPSSLAHGQELFLESKVRRWVGTISGLPGGNPVHETRVKHLPEPREHPGLYVVGDYLFDSTVNGVYDSADFVTDMILTQLRKKKYLDFQSSNYPVQVGNGKPGANVVHTGNGKPGQKDDKVTPLYHDYYYGDVSYNEAFEEDLCFNIDWTVQLIKAVWGKEPPYKVLDAGSASGLTLGVFAQAGIEAWGIENSEYIHAQTPAAWKERNILGDVRKLPFPDNHFDFVYDTCMPYVPPEDLDKAISELFRVAKYGVFFSGVTADMTREVIEDYNLFQGVRSLYTLWEWSEIFMRNGFRMAITDQKKLNDVWKIESEIEEDDWYWYPDKESMRYCFYSKPAGHAARLLTAPPPDKILKAPAAAQELTTQLVVSANGKHVSTNGQVSPDYHDYYNGERPYAECWKECFCESYTIRLIRAIWGKSPPYSILDCGSASGLTIEAFGKVGVEAWGVENSQYIHAQTPAHLRQRNLLGDVRALPFPDNSFDFVYDTSLSHLPKQDLDQAIHELLRVCRVGVFYAGVVKEMGGEVIKSAEDEEVETLLRMDEWAALFERNGFVLATTDSRRLARAWKIEVSTNFDNPWYPDARSMRYCFFSKPGAAQAPARKKRPKLARNEKR